MSEVDELEELSDFSDASLDFGCSTDDEFALLTPFSRKKAGGEEEGKEYDAAGEVDECDVDNVDEDDASAQTAVAHVEESESGSVLEPLDDVLAKEGAPGLVAHLGGARGGEALALLARPSTSVVAVDAGSVVQALLTATGEVPLSRSHGNELCSLVQALAVSEASKATMVKHGACTLLAAVCEAASWDSHEECVLLLEAAVALAEGEEGRSAMVAEGLLDCALPALVIASAGDSAEAALAAARLIKLLSLDEACKTAVVEYGGLDALVACLGRWHLANEGVLSLCCSALYFLVFDVEQLVREDAEHGSTGPLVHVLVDVVGNRGGSAAPRAHALAVLASVVNTHSVAHPTRRELVDLAAECGAAQAAAAALVDLALNAEVVTDGISLVHTLLLAQAVQDPAGAEFERVALAVRGAEAADESTRLCQQDILKLCAAHRQHTREEEEEGEEREGEGEREGEREGEGEGEGEGEREQGEEQGDDDDDEGKDNGEREEELGTASLDEFEQEVKAEESEEEREEQQIRNIMTPMSATSPGFKKLSPELRSPVTTIVASAASSPVRVAEVLEAATALSPKARTWAKELGNVEERKKNEINKRSQRTANNNDDDDNDDIDDEDDDNDDEDDDDDDEDENDDEDDDEAVAAASREAERCRALEEEERLERQKNRERELEQREVQEAHEQQLLELESEKLHLRDVLTRERTARATLEGEVASLRFDKEHSDGTFVELERAVSRAAEFEREAASARATLQQSRAESQALRDEIVNMETRLQARDAEQRQQGQRLAAVTQRLHDARLVVAKRESTIQHLTEHESGESTAVRARAEALEQEARELRQQRGEAAVQHANKVELIKCQLESEYRMVIKAINASRSRLERRLERAEARCLELQSPAAAAAAAALPLPLPLPLSLPLSMSAESPCPVTTSAVSTLSSGQRRDEKRDEKREGLREGVRMDEGQGEDKREQGPCTSTDGLTSDKTGTGAPTGPGRTGPGRTGPAAATSSAASASSAPPVCRLWLQERKPLGDIYSHYATRERDPSQKKRTSALDQHTRVHAARTGMDVRALLQMAADFDVIPALAARNEVRGLFAELAAGPRLDFDAWLRLLERLATTKFSGRTCASVVAQVSAMLQWMDASSGKVKLRHRQRSGALVRKFNVVRINQLS